VPEGLLLVLSSSVDEPAREVVRDPPSDEPPEPDVPLARDVVVLELLLGAAPEPRDPPEPVVRSPVALPRSESLVVSWLRLVGPAGSELAPE
jgi:hypothetical protein